MSVVLTSVCRRCIGLAVLLIAGSSPGFAERAINVVVIDFQLTCDAEQCRTPVLEVHENTGADASYLEYVFAPPAGITFDNTHTTGVEVEGEGETHYVRALADTPGALKCRWLAKARMGAGKGLTKGYCWIAIKK